MSKSRPVVVLATANLLLIDDLARLAAAANVEPVLAHDGADVRRWWNQAELLVLGDDLGAPLGRAAVRRDSVILVGRSGERDVLNETAVALGAEHVATLPDDEAWLVEQVAVAGEGRASGVVVPVVGCRGGAGASTLVAALARQSVDAGLRCAVVDADPLGGDLDALLDMADEPGLRWGDLDSGVGRLPAGPLAAALPQRAGVALLSSQSGFAGGDALVAVVDALARAFDLVLLDVPRWLPGQCRAVIDVADAVLLVTTADLRGVAAAQRLCGDLDSPVRTTRLIVRTARWALDPDEAATVVGLPGATVFRHDRRVPADAALGGLVMRPALRRTARRLLADLADTAPAAGR